jgi:hypothetical protein
MECRRSPEILRLYVFRANVNEVSNALVVGLVLDGNHDIGVVGRIDQLWTEHQPPEALAIIPLSDSLEGQVRSSNVPPFFYR